MSTWFSVVAPFLPDIIKAARPMFTLSRGDDTKAAALVPQQIKELQDAAAQNADAIHTLAGEMQNTLHSLQQGATELERTLARHELALAALDRSRRLTAVAMTMAVLAFALAAYALAT
ncbi:hypothetical protein [Novilysobacter selenitireducens]|uniref:Methyl-accepting chemotaxis protein n=1 Tax=Novilysobacter selenitireducens TaxID=2872639 RepID=A0ABS7T492_9GAMM|nr:hypothetical protein [Lysobacter selenitireducens]MBZ4038683.1 hypothetical protein [Lysobacter selenitireducens]